MHYCATIGNFDGVHRGHRAVLARLFAEAAKRGEATMVVTFDRHPLATVAPERAPRLLISLDERVRRLREAGVERVEVLPFDRAMMSMPAREFMRDVLRDRLAVRTLVTGYDNRFGRRNAAEGFEQYVRYGQELGIDVVLGPGPEACGLFEGRPVSSSLLRRLIAEGRQEAAAALMRPVSER